MMHGQKNVKLLNLFIVMYEQKFYI